MKKLLLAFAIAAISAAALSQGQVHFTSHQGVPDPSGQFPSFDSPVYFETVGGLLISGTQGRIEMLGGPAIGAVAAIIDPHALGVLGNLHDLHNPATTTASWVNFGTRTTAAYSQRQGYAASGLAPTRILPDVPYGGAAEVQVVAWAGPTSANYDTWAEAFDAFYGLNGAVFDPQLELGASAPVLVSHLTLSLIDPNIPVPAWNSFAVTHTTVPEPSGVAMMVVVAGLGLASVPIMRRRAQARQ